MSFRRSRCQKAVRDHHISFATRRPRTTLCHPPRRRVPRKKPLAQLPCHECTLTTTAEEPPAEEEGPKVFEEMRLAVLVEMIDMETAMAPAGALTQLSTGAVKENLAFAGLPAASMSSMSSYVFVNKPKPKNVLQPAMTNALDFLISADTIVPKGSLCAHLDESTGITTIRNLLWPGFVAFAGAGTKTWGYCYCGTGAKNADIAFMLP